MGYSTRAGLPCCEKAPFRRFSVKWRTSTIRAIFISCSTRRFRIGSHMRCAPDCAHTSKERPSERITPHVTRMRMPSVYRLSHPMTNRTAPGIPRRTANSSEKVGYIPCCGERRGRALRFVSALRRRFPMWRKLRECTEGQVLNTIHSIVNRSLTVVGCVTLLGLLCGGCHHQDSSPPTPPQPTSPLRPPDVGTAPETQEPTKTPIKD